MLDVQGLVKVMPTLTVAKATEYLPHLLAAAECGGIDTPERMAAFIAQLAHESGEFKYWEEIWGPTKQQLKYDTTLAKKLGNLVKGDGFRYRGRGPIQLTGRGNYKKYGNLLGLDLVSDPDKVATPSVGFMVAAVFWLINGLNELADRRDFRAITKRINGGLTHIEQRVRYWSTAQIALVEVKKREAVKPLEAPVDIASSGSVGGGDGAGTGGLQPADQ